MPRLAATILRWVGRLLGGLLALALVLVLTVVILAQTDWGRQQIATRAEAALEEVLAGEVTIGRVSGNPLGTFVLHDVAVRDLGGREVVRAPRLEISYSLVALVNRTVRVHELVVVDPWVVARREPDGTLNLANLVPPPETEAPAEPRAWRIVAERATVTGGTVSYENPEGEVLHARNVGLVAALDMNDDELVADLASATATLVEKDIRFTAQGSFRKSEDRVRLSRFLLTAGDSRVAVAGLTADEGFGDLEAEVSLELRAKDVRKLAPGIGWKGRVAAGGRVRRETADDPWLVDLEGTASGAPFELEGRVSLEDAVASLRFQARGLDPEALWEGAPAGKLDVDLAGRDLGGDSLASASGTATLAVSGSLGEERIEELVVTARARRGTAELDVQGQAPRARLQARAILEVSSDPVVVRESRVNAAVEDLKRFLPDRSVAGSVAAEVTARGPMDDLRVEGTVRGQRLRYDQARIRAVRAEVNLAGPVDAPSGTARFRADGVVRGDLDIGRAAGEARFSRGGERIRLAVHANGRGPYALKARVDITVQDDAIRIGIGGTAVRIRGLAWTIQRGQVTVLGDHGVRLEDVVVSSPAGVLRLSGAIGKRGEQLDIEVRSLKMEPFLRAVAPEQAPLRGVVEGHVVVHQRNRRLHEARAVLRGESLAFAGQLDPVDASVKLDLKGRSLSAWVSLDGGETGAVTIEVDTRTPADPLDLAGWRRFSEGDLRRVSLELERLDLARVASILQMGEELSGTVDATFTSGPGLRVVDGTVTAAEVETALVDRPLSGEVKTSMRGRIMAVEANLTREGGGELRGRASVDAPARLTPAAGWKELDQKNLRELSLEVRGIELAWLDPIAERFPGIEGVVSAKVATGRARGGRVAATVTLERVMTERMRLPLGAEIRATLHADRTVAEIASTLGGAPLVNGETTTRAGLRDLEAGRFEAFQRARTTGEMRVSQLSLGLLRRALEIDVPMSGRLSGTAELSGTLEAPTVDVTARLDGGRFQEIRFGRLDARGHLSPARIAGRVIAVQEAGGFLEGSLEMDRSDGRKSAARLRARSFDLGFLAVLSAMEPDVRLDDGMLDANLRIDGNQGRPVSVGWLRLSGGRMRITERLEELRDARVLLRLGEGGRVKIESEARAGASGRLRLDAEGRLVGLRPGPSRGTFRASRVSLSTGRDRVEVSARGSFLGEMRDLYVLEAEIAQARVNLPEQRVGGALHDTGDLEDVVFVDERAREEELAEALEVKAVEPYLRLVVRAPETIVVQGPELRVHLRTDLTVSVFPTHQAIAGTVWIRDGGWVGLFGRRWRFQRSSATFEGQPEPNPRLDLRLVHDFKSATVRIGVGGYTSDPELRLSSEPGAYDQAQLLRFVLGGSPDEEQPGTLGDHDLSEQALGAAGGLMFGKMRPLLQQVVPVDVIKVQQQTANAATLLTLGKWLTNDLFVGYTHRFEGETERTRNRNEATLEWHFLRRWQLEIRFGDMGEGSGDLVWTRRY